MDYEYVGGQNENNKKEVTTEGQCIKSYHTTSLMIYVKTEVNPC